MNEQLQRIAAPTVLHPDQGAMLRFLIEAIAAIIVLVLILRRIFRHF